MTMGLTVRVRPLAAALTFALVLTHASLSRAATYNIANGDVAGLIAAIQSANATAESDVIELAPSGTYVLTGVAEDDGYAGGAGLPYVRSPLTINGHGATIQRSSASGIPDFRIVFVFVSDLILDGVTIAGGRGGNDSRGGGGIGITTGRLAVKNSTITQNFSPGGGGGIASYCGVLTVENSTISYNTGLGGRTGGGILNFSAPPDCYATAHIVSSTIFENRAADVNLPGRGDAIADAFSSPQPTITVKNSILASPAQGVGQDCSAPPGVIVSEGGNIAADDSCGLAGSLDQNSTDPMLGPLADNGGPTLTHSPLPGSPAVDAVPVAACTDSLGNLLAIDQRGVSRPQRAACDVGAVEVVQRSYSVCALYDPTRAVRSGATIPIKFQLCDGAGTNLSTSTLVVHATGISQSSSLVSGALQDAGNANPDFDFRFDAGLADSGGYIFNLSTRGLATGTYNLNFTVSGDSLTYSVPFQVK
jgi:hypothetical protein